MLRTSITPPRLAAAFILLLTTAWAAEPLAIVDPWIREAPPNAAALAAYFRIDNGSADDRRLVAVEAPAFARAMIHETVLRDGVARMEHRDAVTVQAGGSVQFAPGALHVMLMGPALELHAGDHVPLTLVFDDGERVTATFPVRRAGP